MFTVEQVKLMNKECAAAFKSAWDKVRLSNHDLHAQFVMSNVGVAVRYLQHIHQIAIGGYSPIAVSVFRTYYEIVCSTMYLAEHKDELDDFLKFGRLMYHEVGQRQNASDKQLNQLVPDHRELRQHFAEKRKQRGGKLPSWHGMTIDDLGKAVGMEKYADHKIVRSQYFTASKLVHGDSLLTMLAYNLDQFGIQPTPFAPPVTVFRGMAVAATCALFISLLATVDVGLMIGFKDELDKLNAVWHQIWLEATGVDPQDTIDSLSQRKPS